MVIPFAIGGLPVIGPANLVSEMSSLLWFADRCLGLSMAYMLPLTTLSMSSPSRFGTVVAKYFNVIFILLAVVSLFYDSTATDYLAG